MSEQVIEQPTEQPIEEQPTEQPVEQAATPADDAEFEQQLEAAAIEVPDGEKLVPLSAVREARAKARDYKAEAARAKELEAELARVKADQDENRPWIEAAKTIAAARQLQGPQVQQQPPQQDPRHVAQLTELARALDLYRADGAVDLDKAQKIHDYNRSVAEQTARQVVEPLAQTTLQQRVDGYYQRALQTTAADGSKPDPAILRDHFARVGSEVSGTEQGASILWKQALAESVLQGKLVRAKAAAAASPLPAPLLTERAGGREVTDQSPMSASEKTLAKQLGISEKEYMESANAAPWLRRNR